MGLKKEVANWICSWHMPSVICWGLVEKYHKNQLETQWKFPFHFALAAMSSEQKVSMKDVVKMPLGHDSV